MEILKDVHVRNLVEWAKNKPETYVLSADLINSSEAHLFRDAYPARFLSMGITEQNMLASAGGMAREDLISMIHTSVVFIYRRAYDQIAMSVAYSNLPVITVGFLPGILTPGGATYQAIEDISMMRSFPNMTVLETVDAIEIESVLDVALEAQRSVYIRILRGEIPRLFDQKEPMKLGEARRLREGNDFVLISSGIYIEEGVRAVAALADQGIHIVHYHMSTLRPPDHPEIMEEIAKSKYGAITLENHSVIGGLGSIVAEQMAEYEVGKKFYRLGLNDTPVHGASKEYPMKECGFDAMALISEVEAMTGEQCDIKEESLTETYYSTLHSEAKPGAL